MPVITVEVSVEGAERPAAGSVVHVEARDTSLADAPSVTLARATGQVRGSSGPRLETLELRLDRVPSGCTVWAHVDVDRNGRVSSGDFVTMTAYPVAQAERVRVAVGVRKVS
jgi:uncharacterized lipoprotein YbaY